MTAPEDPASSVEAPMPLKVMTIVGTRPEIIKLANRILVFKAGRIVGEVDGVDNPDKTYDELSMAIGNYMQ